MDVTFLETNMLFSSVTSYSSLQREMREEMLNWLKFDWPRLDDMESPLTITFQAPQSIAEELIEMIELNIDEPNTKLKLNKHSHYIVSKTHILIKSTLSSFH